MYPKNLQPTDFEPFIIYGKTVNIPKCLITFDKWIGEPVKETFGGKPIVKLDNKPMFAELAIMTLFRKDGWLARWVETYGKKVPICLDEWKDDKYKNQVHRPFLDSQIESLLSEIAKENSSSYSGCWDVVAIKNGKIIFVESKRTKKDRIRITQTNWLISGLKCGLNTENFLIVQWDM
ncbi:MAG: hypothetical protein Q8N05_14035 [Bacteroidota bacterium]|nr:hypothetical protein [Bacteroidota bacterium]